MLKQFLSSKTSSAQANIALLILRIGIGIIMIPHGYQKLINYAELEDKFLDFMGLGKSISLSLTIGAELFCSVLLVIGLFTRFSLLPLIIAMLVAVFNAHHGEIFGDGEHAFLYLLVYIYLIITGAGKYSVDGLLFDKPASTIN